MTNQRETKLVSKQETDQPRCGTSRGVGTMEQGPSAAMPVVILGNLEKMVCFFGSGGSGGYAEYVACVTRPENNISAEVKDLGPGSLGLVGQGCCHTSCGPVESLGELWSTW